MYPTTARNKSLANSRQITLSNVREWTEQSIENAIQAGGDHLIESPPSGGKTSSIPKIAARNDEPITYLAPLRRMYEDMESLCDEHRQTSKMLLSAFDTCPSFPADPHDTDDSDGEKRSIAILYRAGMSARRIHALFDLPCEPECPYMRDREFDPSEYDVIICNHLTAHMREITEGRTVICDEFPGDAFVTTIHAKRSIDTYLSRVPNRRGLPRPFENYDDLIENRDDRDRTAVTLAYLREHGASPDDGEAREQGGHALAPYLVFALLHMHDLGNGFEVCAFPGSYEEYGLERRRLCVREAGTDKMHVLTPPDLSGANAVVGLDATPTKSMWDLTYDLDFQHERILSDDEMKMYVRDVLDIDVQLVGKARKPYSSGEWIARHTDAAVTIWAGIEHECKPIVISTRAWLNGCNDNEPALIAHDTADTLNFARVNSNNDYGDERLLVIHGSPHPGDIEIKKWGAFMFERIERQQSDEDLTYGPLGDEIHRHFAHNRVGQAALRIGREGNGATIVVNTSVHPDWLRFHGGSEVTIPAGFPLRPENKRQVARYLMDRAEDGGSATIQGITGATHVSESTARRAVDNFIDQGWVDLYAGIGLNGENEYVWNP